MNLPMKDKDGNSYLSYSCISSYLNDKSSFIETYILKKPFSGNAYTEFGNKVGKSLELGCFDAFSDPEINVLKTVTRLDLFEKKILLKYDSFYIIGYIDTCSSDLSEIIDYKTGGANKELQYLKSDYIQLCYYALGIKQEFGAPVNKASVEFIRRGGSEKKGLIVSSEPVIKIPIDVSNEKLKFVYWQTIKVAKEISEFYTRYLDGSK